MEANKTIIKELLFKALKQANALWSYNTQDINIEKIPDELLIEKVLLHLDIDDINKLFEIYPKKEIKNVWIKRLIPLEPQYHSYNILFGLLYFDIKKPERYIKQQVNKHIKQLILSSE